MNSLPVLLLLLIKNRVLVLGQHLLLSGHLCVPPLNGLCCQPAISLQRRTHGIYHAVDGAEALALSCLLRTGESPRDFPVEVIGQ